MHIFYRLALKIRPGMAEMNANDKAGALSHVYTFMWSTPLAILGLLWLMRATELTLVQAEILPLLILLVVGIVLRRFEFRMQLQLQKGMFAATRGSLESLVRWSAALIFGPSALWLGVIGNIVNFIVSWRQERTSMWRWYNLSTLASSLSGTTLAGLCGLWVYFQLGGNFPFTSLFSLESFLPALLGSLTVWAVEIILSAFILFFVVRAQKAAGVDYLANQSSLTHFFLVNLGLRSPIYPFAILAAAIYSLGGIGVYLFLMAGVLAFSLLARSLTAALQHNERRTQELQILQELVQSILSAPPDNISGQLPDILAKHAPRMLQKSDVFIWLYPDIVLLEERVKPRPLPNLATVQEQVLENQQDYYVYNQIILIEEGKTTRPHQGLAVPIRDVESQVLGGIFIIQQPNTEDVTNILPAIQSLVTQIAIALRREEIYRQTIANERMTRELEVAGHIQSTFLPDEIPQADGWQITATIIPARQTSGDFYDFMHLENGRLGILVADVADKGTGAALYMALSRTLIRTYALQYPDAPETALQLANERILADTQSDQFVTVFYGVLDLVSGLLTYCNAGHNPAYLLHPDGAPVTEMRHTGIPLGMFPEMEWQQAQCQINPDAVLLLYTDGVTEAQNSAKELFEEPRLINTATSVMSSDVETIQADVVEAIQTFVGTAPQFDDITMLFVKRLSV